MWILFRGTSYSHFCLTCRTKWICWYQIPLDPYLLVLCLSQASDCCRFLANLRQPCTGPALLQGMKRYISSQVHQRLCSAQLFNPPYVPTPDEEMQRADIARAWAGGNRGRITIDRFLSQVCYGMCTSDMQYTRCPAANFSEGWQAICYVA